MWMLWKLGVFRGTPMEGILFNVADPFSDFPSNAFNPGIQGEDLLDAVRSNPALGDSGTEAINLPK